MANLEGANLKDSICRYTNFMGSNMRNVNLDGTDLFGANLTDVDLTGANLKGAKNWEYAIMSNENRELFRIANSRAESKFSQIWNSIKSTIKWLRQL